MDLVHRVLSAKGEEYAEELRCPSKRFSVLRDRQEQKWCPEKRPGKWCCFAGSDARKIIRGSDARWREEE